MFKKIAIAIKCPRTILKSEFKAETMRLTKLSFVTCCFKYTFIGNERVMIFSFFIVLNGIAKSTDLIMLN